MHLADMRCSPAHSIQDPAPSRRQGGLFFVPSSLALCCLCSKVGAARLQPPRVGSPAGGGTRDGRDGRPNPLLLHSRLGKGGELRRITLRAMQLPKLYFWLKAGLGMGSSTTLRAKTTGSRHTPGLDLKLNITELLSSSGSFSGPSTKFIETGCTVDGVRLFCEAAESVDVQVPNISHLHNRWLHWPFQPLLVPSAAFGTA